MNIYAKYGDKVVFAHPDCGYDSDIKFAARHLTAGREYTVEATDVHSFHTNVLLKEVPGILFNSVHFDDVPNLK